MNDTELERVLRRGLDVRAGQAVVDREVVGRARRAATRRRAATWAASAVAAAAVVAVGVVAATTGEDRALEPSRPSGPASTAPVPPSPSSPSSAAPRPGRARVEQWRGLQVLVPEEFGYGNVGTCGDVPVGTPYVGRPIGITDACSVPDLDATPTAPYVWFDAGVPVGVADLGDGWSRETVQREGVLVSIAYRDEETRAFLSSGIGPATICPGTIEDPPEPRLDDTVEGRGDFRSARACSYREDTNGSYRLVHAAVLAEDVVQRTATAVAAAPAAGACASPTFEVVVLTATYDDPDGAQDLGQDVVYELSCGVVEQRDGPGEGVERHRVTEATVPWAGPEYGRLLTGPTAYYLAPFIGVQG